MRTIGASLLTALAQENTYLCRIWKLTLAGTGQELFYTDCPQVVRFGGDDYLPDPGIQVSAVQQALGGATQNCTMDIYFASAGLSATDVRGGLLDSAKFVLSIVDYTNPDGLGSILLMSGRVTGVEFDDKGQCTVTLGGALSNTAPDVAEYYSKTCRARLGDSRCTKDLTPWTITGVVTAVDGTSLMTFSSTTLAGVQADGFYNLGIIEWTDGPNQGRKDEIAVYTSAPGKVVLSVAPAFPISIGDGFIATPGCDKTIQTCKVKYSNLVNFRGEALAPPPGLNPITAFQNPSATSTYETGGRGGIYA